MILATLPLYAFVLSIVGYCFGRLVLVWISSGVKTSNVKLGVALSNAAEVDSAFEKKRLTEEERFELEKRAFFSKVCLTTRAVGGSSILRGSLEALELTVTVLAFCVPSKQVHSAW